jgi:hypothetical protein
MSCAAHSTHTHTHTHISGAALQLLLCTPPSPATAPPRGGVRPGPDPGPAAGCGDGLHTHTHLAAIQLTSNAIQLTRKAIQSISSQGQRPDTATGSAAQVSCPIRAAMGASGLHQGGAGGAGEGRGGRAWKRRGAGGGPGRIEGERGGGGDLGVEAVGVEGRDQARLVLVEVERPEEDGRQLHARPSGWPSSRYNEARSRRITDTADPRVVTDMTSRH